MGSLWLRPSRPANRKSHLATGAWPISTARVVEDRRTKREERELKKKGDSLDEEVEDQGALVVAGGGGDGGGVAGRARRLRRGQRRTLFGELVVQDAPFVVQPTVVTPVIQRKKTNKRNNKKNSVKLGNLTNVPQNSMTVRKNGKKLGKTR